MNASIASSSSSSSARSSPPWSSYTESSLCFLSTYLSIGSLKIVILNATCSRHARTRARTWRPRGTLTYPTCWIIAKLTANSGFGLSAHKQQVYLLAVQQTPTASGSNLLQETFALKSNKQIIFLGSPTPSEQAGRTRPVIIGGFTFLQQTSRLQRIRPGRHCHATCYTQDRSHA